MGVFEKIPSHYLRQGAFRKCKQLLALRILRNSCWREERRLSAIAQTRQARDFLSGRF